jgi:hypothetical protein
VPKYPPIWVGHYNAPSSSPILHLNWHPFQWASSIPCLIHQYCTQITTHFRWATTIPSLIH